MYHINYHTGAGNFSIDGTLEDAKRAADEGAAYTQQPIIIHDEDGNEVARRQWWGCREGIEECDDPISYGDFGFYGDWR